MSMTDITGSNLLGDKAYGTKEILAYIEEHRATAVIPPKSNTKEPWPIDLCLYKERHLIECFFQKIIVEAVQNPPKEDFEPCGEFRRRRPLLRPCFVLHRRRRYAKRTWRANRPTSSKDANLRLLNCADYKWFRRVATRYDKLDKSFLAFVYMAAILIWLL